MMFTKKLCLAIIILFGSVKINAQQVDTVLNKKNDSAVIAFNRAMQPTRQKQNVAKSFIAPALMLGYGLIAINSRPLLNLNEDLKKDFWTNNPHAKFHLDNYLQFAPAAAVYALNIAGVKGKNNFRDRSMIYFISNVFLSTTVYSIKSITKIERPDGSANNSFPSGHTAEAFASAEFLRQEYKDISGWYGVAGYVAATATGLLRMYNNKHWFSDVVAGAGVGIASTKLAYIVYPAIRKKLFPKKTESHTVIMPFYQNKQGGFSMLYQFN